MRSLFVKAALAAFLISTPLTTAFAASMHDHETGTPGAFSERDHLRDNSPNRFGGDQVPGYSKYARNGQLEAILNDLSDANARVAYDRSQGLITPAEAHSLRVEERTIRTEAIANNARHRGMIPMGHYEQLMAPVENLQSQL